jgi:hypothetical protein
MSSTQIHSGIYLQLRFYTKLAEEVTNEHPFQLEYKLRYGGKETIWSEN